MTLEVKDEAALQVLAERLGQLLKGGEVIELVGDVGAGKTSFVKGLARGLGIHEAIQSPSFTINRVYDARDGLRLAHYDFYRLSEAGIMRDELLETVHDPQTVTAIEWANIVEGVLPENRLTIRFAAPTETSRRLTVSGNTKLWEEL